MVDAVDELRDGRTEGVALNIALGIDKEEIIQSIQDLVDQLTQHPKVLADVWQELMTSTVSITMGLSSLDLSKDRRFVDPAWQENPVYRRLGQYYLAFCKALDTWLKSSELDEMSDKRARFLLGILKDLLAPVNNMYSNPRALSVPVD